MIPNQKKHPKTYPIDLDNELLVWEKWITIRKEETTKLAKKTRRPPADLVMNLYENVRPDRERKIALEEAKIPQKVGVRDSLWEQPQRLQQKCYCEPVYEVQRTRAEMGRPRKIEHIDVPAHIKVTELGYAGVHHRLQCEHLDSEYHQYRERREKELQEKILKIDPFRPEIHTLMIKGINPPPPPKKKPILPDVKETLDNNPACVNLHAVYALRVNNTIFLKEVPEQNLTDLKQKQKEPWHENCTSWTYYFNTPVTRAGRGKLYLQNLGTVTIRYCWKKLKKPIPFIPEDEVQMFFFNKNEDLLTPGQEKYVFFTFVSEKPGIYKEYWELSLCNIGFFDTLTDKLVINLLADSKEDYITTNMAIAQLKSEMDIKSIQFDALQLINDAISKAVAIQPEIYPYKDYFLEAEIFIMKNPVCFYHQTEVAKMKDYYAEMRRGEDWDLSIRSWREQMLQKEFDERMKYYELLRKSHSDFLKPWHEGDDLLKSKYRAVTLLLVQLADEFDSEHDRIFNPAEEAQSLQDTTYTSIPSRESLHTDQPNIDMMRNLYYIKMFEHIGDTMEACAGVLSSLDLDRWIEFDLCRT
ncbi:MYCBP-associated protein-like [Cydia pomonella]|uniref:MYCBP-associated protein-like n=1 Tax=Cydia pomonella TaxID=82600 RepID=UPI002ADE80A3|nr:MYCBP-associated protein-like [Cydia pomonella]